MLLQENSNNQTLELEELTCATNFEHLTCHLIKSLRHLGRMNFPYIKLMIANLKLDTNQADLFLKDL